MSESQCKYGYLPVRDRFGSADGTLQNAGEVTSLSSGGIDLWYTNRRSKEKENSDVSHFDRYDELLEAA